MASEGGGVKRSDIIDQAVPESCLEFDSIIDSQSLLIEMASSMHFRLEQLADRFLGIPDLIGTDKEGAETPDQQGVVNQIIRNNNRLGGLLSECFDNIARLERL